MVNSLRNWILDVVNIRAFTVPAIDFSDLLEIFVISCVIYLSIRWIKRTNAWILLRGIIVILLIYLVSIVFNLWIILWIMQIVLTVLPVLVVVLFGPEIRSLLTQIGRAEYLGSFKNESEQTAHTSVRTVNEIIKATKSMSASQTGALIVLEQEVDISEHEQKGEELDSKVSSRLLLSIFKKNSPIHDGAVIIRNNRISSAACTLPTSSGALAEELGTRHQAAVGISEVSDARVVVVSEETGCISVAIDGKLTRNVNENQMRELLISGAPRQRVRLPGFRRENIGKKGTGTS